MADLLVKRVEYGVNGSGHKVKLHVVDCLMCGKEMRKQTGALKRHTGYCVRCVKRKDAHPYQTVYNGMLDSVRRANDRFDRDVKVDLSFEEFLFLTQIGVCAYCNTRVKWTEYAPGPYNLDRMDNDRGYEMGNVVVCCFECNHRKGKHWDSEEFRLLSEFIRIHRSAPERLRSEMRYALSEWKAEAEFLTEQEAS